MLHDIRACVEDEPASGPWFAVRHSPTQFAIFEAFPDIAGRDAHVAGRGGDIFRDVERMNVILRRRDDTGPLVYSWTPTFHRRHFPHCFVYRKDLA